MPLQAKLQCVGNCSAIDITTPAAEEPSLMLGHICIYVHAVYLLKGDAVVWDDSKHACQQVLHLTGDVGWSVIHPLDDLLAQLLYMTNYQSVLISTHNSLSTDCCCEIEMCDLGGCTCPGLLCDT